MRKIDCFPCAGMTMAGMTKTGEGHCKSDEIAAKDSVWGAIMEQPFNNVVDSLLVLPYANPVAGQPKYVALGLQNKECRDAGEAFKNTFGAEKSKLRDLSMKSNAAVETFLEDHDFVHVLVTPNAILPKDKLKTWSVHGKTLHEATLTHADIREWSPMVAYSGCDARVLQLSDDPVNPLRSV
jgi:hypothetical protein